MLRAVDVMGFAGGFTLGVTRAGFELVGKREMKGGFGVANCEANRHLLGENWDVEATAAEAWSVPQGGADLVFGNPPCSGFSVLSTPGFRGVGSKIEHCMWSFVRYAARCDPKIVIFESVQQAYTQGMSLMLDLLAELKKQTVDDSWTLTHVLHNNYSVGGVSLRPRYFWVASRVPFGTDDPVPLRLPTLWDAIDDLVNLKMDVAPQMYLDDPSWYGNRYRSVSGEVDGHVALDNPNTRRTRDLLRATEWNAGEDLQRVLRRHYRTHGELPQSFHHVQDKLVARDFFCGFNTPVRWFADRAARVITGAGLINTIHPFHDRTVTHREVARIMGFPDDWKIRSWYGGPGATMTWGKGISVPCGEWIARWARNALEGNPGANVGVERPDGCRLIDVTHNWKRSCDTMTVAKKNMVRFITPKRKETPVTDPETTDEAKRGRPRPEATLQRDEQVYNFISASEMAPTRDAVATGLDIPAKLVYMSLYRLSHEGKIERIHADGAHRWRVALTELEAVAA